MIDSRYLAAFLFIIIIGFVASCSTTEQSQSPDISPQTTADSTADVGEVTALQQLLNDNRSGLSDVYLSQHHDMPKQFTKKASEASLNRNPYNGFRVQILSSRNVEAADSLADAFRVWADTTINGYRPRAYVSFNQPHFKVRIGDFQLRDKANTFSKLIKEYYPKSWVVHDRINPSDVPADTAEISITQQ